MRKHQPLLIVARSLLFQASLPVKFWGDAVLTAPHIIKRVPSPILNKLSPYELLYQKSSSYSHLEFPGPCGLHPLLVKHWKKFELRAH